MARTRAAVLRGARESILRHGTRKTTMVEIARVSGVAKATLYNHFRAKEQVFSALVDSEVDAVAAAAREHLAIGGPSLALTRAAEHLATHPLVRRLAQTEPATVAALTLPGAEPAAAWTTARTAVAEVVGEDGPVELVLRWLVSQLLYPAPHDELEATVSRLLTAATDAAGGPSPVHLGFPRVHERVPGVLTEVR